MEVSQEVAGNRVVGGVDTHKDLHVAAVVDGQDRVLGSQCFATTRQGYRQMLAWMRSFGTLQRIGVEATGTYGAGLLRYMQQAGIEVLEVTTPDSALSSSDEARRCWAIGQRNVVYPGVAPCELDRHKRDHFQKAVHVLFDGRHGPPWWRS
jgi:hypothetical protein